MSISLLKFFVVFENVPLWYLTNEPEKWLSNVKTFPISEKYSSDKWFIPLKLFVLSFALSKCSWLIVPFSKRSINCIGSSFGLEITSLGNPPKVSNPWNSIL